jgi:hypothetical protein
VTASLYCSFIYIQVFNSARWRAWRSCQSVASLDVMAEDKVQEKMHAITCDGAGIVELG